MLEVMKKEIENVHDYKTPAIPGCGINPPEAHEFLMNGINQIKFQSFIGSLLYLARFTRPDIINGVR